MYSAETLVTGPVWGGTSLDRAKASDISTQPGGPSWLTLTRAWICMLVRCPLSAWSPTGGRSLMSPESLRFRASALTGGCLASEPRGPLARRLGIHGHTGVSGRTSAIVEERVLHLR